MTPLGWAVMVIICGVVWGGFVALGLRAIGRERRKDASPETSIPTKSDGSS